MKFPESLTIAKERFLRIASETPGLAQTEDLIRRCFDSEASALTSISGYLLDTGGKRLRPLLALLSARVFDQRAPASSLIEAAAALEMIHMATLLHDDIIDHSPLRRRRESPLARFGMSNTLLTGDFLLVRAFGLCARLDQFIVEAAEAACVELTEGEILETGLNAEVHDLQSSLRIAEKKTAALFWFAARAGSHLGGASVENIERLSSFGRTLGIAFQILDDILDVSADESAFGKRCGTDLRERKPSIINVLWLRSGSTLARRLNAAPEENEDAFVDKALAELKSGTVLEEAKCIASSYTSTAANILQELRSSEEIDAKALSDLRHLVDYTVCRLE